MTASGCKFKSQLYRMLLVWPLLEEENTGWLSLLPSQTEALSHWTGTRFVCTTAWQTTNTWIEAALRSDVCHPSVSDFGVFFSDKVTVLDRAVMQRSLKGIHNLVSDSLRNAEEKVHLKKSLRCLFFCHNICW